MATTIKRLVRTGLDLVVLAGALIGAFLLRFEFAIPEAHQTQLVIVLPYVVGLKYAAMRTLGVHLRSWRYSGLGEIALIVRAAVASTMLLLAARIVAPAFVGLWMPARYAAIPIGVILADLALTILGLLALRVVRRALTEQRELRGRRTTDVPLRRVLLIGAGRAGVVVAKELANRPDIGIVPVGFVDDDPHKQRQVIAGVPVLGPTTELAAIVQRLQVDEAIITMAAVAREDIRRITQLCEDAELDTKIIPGIYEIVDGRVNVSRIRPVAIEDLLGREPVDLDISSIREYVAHEVVLVTGAGGSIGSELCRQLARFNPRALVLLEQSENALWAIHGELERTFPDVHLVPAIADVCDEHRVDNILLAHRPSTIFHAAAHKHVPMMEANPGEAVKNNVLGTKTVADLALARGVHRFVLISTDKAVNPTSVMGATKRVAERYVQHLADRSGKPYVSVRFGNVLGSTGSVVPVFNEQIARGGPVTVTDPDMVRYFMTIPEAAQLVLQAAALGESGEIFVLDMGDPVRIVDLAHDLIRLSGFEPERDIAIEFTGIRPGEKMFEELALSDENADRTGHPKVWVGRSPSPTWVDAMRDVAHLASRLDTASADDVRAALAVLVPEYTTGELAILADDHA